MSKSKKKQKQHQQETQQERSKRLIQEAGFVQKNEPETREGPTEANDTLIPPIVPDGVDDKTIEFMAALDLEKERLSELEKKLKEKQDNIDQLVQKKADEFIKNLGVDIPTAQEKVRAILEEAGIERDKLISDGKRIATDLEAKANTAIDDAANTIKRLKEREKKLNELTEDLSKKSIALQNEELAYRAEIGEEINAKYREDIAKIDSFEDEKSKLIRKSDYFKNQYEEINSQLNELQHTLVDYETTKRELSKTKEDCVNLENEIRSLREKTRQQNEELRRIGDDPLIYKNQFDSLQKSYKELQDRLANMPGEIELAELRRKAEELAKISRLYLENQEKLFTTTSELNELRTKASQVDDYIQYVRILTESKRQLQMELAALQDQYESENNNKFKALANYDRKPPEPSELPKFNGNLNTLVHKFLGFSQNEAKPLYYEESAISAFISWMASTKTMVLEGLSGTGKTSLPLAFNRFAGWYTPRVSVQSAWKDRNDLVGFFNDFKKEYKETEFLKDLYRATQDPDRPALIVLDEMNLSRIEYYFADFLSALEEPNPNNRVIDLLPDQSTNVGMPALFVDGGKLPIRENIWFIGTANKDDSTFAITDKVYDRAGVIYFSKRGQRQVNRVKENPIFVSFVHLNHLFEEAKKNFEPTANSLYQKVRNELIDMMSTYFEINLGNRIINQMDIFVPVYLRCRASNDSQTVYEAIDQFFPHKVLRKLEGLYDANTKNNIGEMIKDLSKYSLPKISEYLRKLQSKID